MDRMTLSTLHHFDEPNVIGYGQQLALNALHLPPVILMERRGHSRSLSLSNVFQHR
jgi:hypothetical protein